MAFQLHLYKGMTATYLRNRLRDLKLAKELVRLVREDLKNVEVLRNGFLLNDLTNIEIAIELAHEDILKELIKAGLLENGL